ncbi:MAG: immunity 27 family protein [Methylobacillus sp.]|jgi:hypothetical protein|nr:immunity 27 family protein [Methylobacillus sp.]
MNKYPCPAAQEVALVGSWAMVAGKIVADSVCQRIEYLIGEIFVRIAADSSGWFVLYEDPSDGRYWELSYPQSESHGGGTPRLDAVERNEVLKKYGNFNVLNPQTKSIDG